MFDKMRCKIAGSKAISLLTSFPILERQPCVNHVKSSESVGQCEVLTTNVFAFSPVVLKTRLSFAGPLSYMC